MNSEGKPSEPSHDTLDDAFFSRDPVAPSAQAESAPSDSPPAPKPRGADVSASADDELSRMPDLAPDYDEDAVLGRNRGPGAFAAVLVLVGAVVGSVAGYFVLRQAPSKDAPTSAASASASAAKVVAAPSISASEPLVVASAAPGANATKASAGKARTASAKSAGTGELAGFAAPNVGGPSGASALAKGELSAGEISGVVERNRPLIKRRCWQPELEIRKAMGFAGSARVNASFTIGPSGSVQSASASGAENDYPGLSSCIAARIREWKFPPSSGSTPVNVPFVFAAN